MLASVDIFVEKQEIKSKVRNIRDLRMSKHMKQKELVCLAQVSINELCMCERGLSVPHEKFFKSIGDVFGIPYMELMSAHQKIYENPKSGEGYITQTNNSSFVIPRKKTPKQHTKKVLDLFCGTGGLSHGFEQTKKFEVVAGLDLLEGWA